MTSKERITYLLQQMRLKQLTAEEEEELQEIFRSATASPQIKAAIEAMMQQPALSNSQRSDAEWEAMAGQIMDTDRVTAETAIIPSSKPFFNARIWTAAAAVTCISIGAWWWFSNKPAAPADAPVVTTPVTAPPAIDPGRNGAILTLDDNSEVLLDSAVNGLVADQHGAKVLLKDGKLQYEGSAAKVVSYNRMSTPRGRQFQLLLSDGTRVWLNAASSIRYPTLFTEKERKVEITGEVYFEVASAANRPFKVIVNDKATVDVLGTDFNINAYEDESRISTTLVDGSVKITAANKTPVLLKPGQQAAIVRGTPDAISISDADINKVTAWKNGVFNFEGASLDEVMRQLSRWYDIEVEYEQQNIPSIRFGGKMSRNVSFGDMLKALELSKVKFRLEGRKLLISK